MSRIAVQERRRAIRRRRRLAAAALGVVLLGGIAGGLYLWRTSGNSPGRNIAVKRGPRTFAVPAWSLVATLRQPVTAYAGPTTASPASTIPVAWASQFLSVPVVARVPGWDQVLVVARPPAPVTVWIPAGAAELKRTPYHIVVDSGIARLLLFRRSRLIMCAPANIGADASPTPIGHYFVGLLVRPPPSDAGSFVVLTSAVTLGVTDWEQSGNAIVTIAAPAGAAPQIEAAGNRTTTGSVQLAPPDQLQLRPVPLGSPVDVLATLNRKLNRPDERLCTSKTGLPPRVPRHR